MRKRGKKGIAAALAAIVLGGTAGWMAFHPEDCTKAHNLYLRTLVFLKLAPGAGVEAGFWCPMHPEIRRQAPGTCPICNMALVPLEGEPAAGEPGVLSLTDRQVQQAGVRMARVSTRDLVREIDATGHLDLNHHRHRTITSWIPGRSRIQRLHVHFTGETIREGQVMAELYSPTLVTSIEELRLASRAYESAGENTASEAVRSARRLMESARERLLRFGLSAEQVRDLAAPSGAGPAIPTIPIRAPLSGTLLQPAGVKEGGYIEEGEVLFQVADLSSLWLFVDVYEYELPFVAAGETVEFSTRAHPGRTFEGEIRLIEPLVRERTRTIRVRCAVDNRDGKLSPGMYARVRLRSVLPRRLAVPESAVLSSGRRDIAIVSEGEGLYRPTRVSIGLRYLYPNPAGASPATAAALAVDERYHEVLSGLHEGDRVVTAGNFLLNAEAQFQGILEKMLPAPDAAKPAPGIPAEVRRRFDEILRGYLRLGAALAADRREDLAEPAREVRRLAAEAGGLLPQTGSEDLRGILQRLEHAAGAFVESPDLTDARHRFAALSREVIAYLRDFSPDRVANGEFHVFRCPMADDEDHRFGFDLWVQKEPDVANPYMGRWMPG